MAALNHTISPSRRADVALAVQEGAVPEGIFAMFIRKRDEAIPQPAPRNALPRASWAPAEASPADAIEITDRNSRSPLANLGTGSVIGRDLVIEGEAITVRCKGLLRVDGQIRADLHGQQIVVGPEGLISGTIAAHEVSVEGRVNGAILAKTLVLRATAEVRGDIHSEFLSIELGATFDGRARRVTDPAEIAPQLDPPPALEQGTAEASAAAGWPDQSEQG